MTAERSIRDRRTDGSSTKGQRRRWSSSSWGLGARLLCWLTGLLVVAACSQGPAPRQPTHGSAQGARKPATGAPELPGPPGLPATIIAEVAAEDAVVHFARNGSDGLLVVRRGGRWLTGPVAVTNKGGTASAPADEGQSPGMRDVAPAPTASPVTQLVAAGDGFVLAWLARTDQGDEIWTLELSTDGGPQSEPVRLREARGPVEWIEVLAGTTGVIVLWEVRGQTTSTLSAAALSAGQGTVPVTVATAVGGWQATATPDGAAVAWVSTGGGNVGQVWAAEIDRAGKLGKAAAVTTKPTALPDVQITTVGDGYLLGWTDAAGSDPSVRIAQVKRGGELVAAPAAPLPPLGGQTLVALVAGPGQERALLVWEPNLGAASGSGAPRAVTDGPPRVLMLATLTSGGQLDGNQASLEFRSPTGSPHVTADEGGFTALTLGSLERAATTGGAEAGPVVPVYVRFDEQLKLRAAEPLRLAELQGQSDPTTPGVPQLVSSLHCEGGLCTVLAHGDGNPALLAVATLPARRAPWRKPARRLAAPLPPLAETLATVVDEDQPIADLSAARLADGRTLVAWITHFLGNEGAAPGPAPAGAKLAYRIVATDGSLGEVRTLSRRAISIGGVKVAAVPVKQGKPPRRTGPVGVIAWAGPNANASQVFVTTIGADGRKARQRTVTKIARPQASAVPNEVFDVDIVADDQGNFICAWSDTRDGDLEVYVARVSPLLQKSTLDQRITHSAGPSMEAQLAVTGKRTAVLWSDAPGSSGTADVFVRLLNTQTLKPVGETQPLSKTSAHSRTPRWAGSAAGQLAATWIEESPADQTSTGSMRLVALGDDGQPTTAIRSVTLGPDLPVISAVASCDAKTCRGVLAGSAGAVLQLGAFSTPRDTGSPVQAKPLFRLAGGTAQDLSLTATAPSLDTSFFAHDRAGGARLRRLHVAW
ncbi:MAG: hypothetical protein JRI68_03235 [Deltaproteobacteria bacterium]|nr:hypothetical protein [Deltaproteobacteria bacterium]